MCPGRVCVCSHSGQTAGTEYLAERKVGHSVVDWPGWVTNDARYSTQPDIQPLKIAPVHFTDWTGRQIQLSNGWALTNWGKRAPYDWYLRMLYSSNSGTSKAYPFALKENRMQATGSPGPSTKQLQAQISSRSPSETIGPGAGKLAPGVTLTGRRYYG